jgi:hypothetical protein
MSIADQPVAQSPHERQPTDDGQPTSGPARSSGRTGRRVGYGIAAGINGLLLYLVNVSPGWEAVSFLTESFASVVGLLNASLAVGLAVNLLWIVADPPWLRSLGQVVQSGLGLAVVLTLLDIFPFDVTINDLDLAWLLRFVLIIIAIATGIGLLVQMGMLVRYTVRSGSD